MRSAAFRTRAPASVRSIRLDYFTAVSRWAHPRQAEKRRQVTASLLRRNSSNSLAVRSGSTVSSARGRDFPSDCRLLKDQSTLLRSSFPVRLNREASVPERLCYLLLFAGGSVISTGCSRVKSIFVSAGICSLSPFLNACVATPAPAPTPAPIAAPLPPPAIAPTAAPTAVPMPTFLAVLLP